MFSPGNGVSSSFLGGMLGSRGPVLGTPRSPRQACRLWPGVVCISYTERPPWRSGTLQRGLYAPEGLPRPPCRPVRASAGPDRVYRVKHLKNHVFRSLSGPPAGREPPAAPNHLRIESVPGKGCTCRVLQGRRIARALQAPTGPHPVYPVFAACRVRRERVRPLWSANTAES